MSILFPLVMMTFIIVFEIRRKKVLKFDFLSIFHIFFIIYYPVSLFALDVNNDVKLRSIQPGIEVEYWKTALAITIAYFSLIVGFYSTLARSLAKRVCITNRKSLSSNIFFICFIILVSFFSAWIYSQPFGGLLKVIQLAHAIRGAEVEGSLTLDFFRRFIIGFQISTLFIFAILCNSYKKRLKSVIYVILLLSIIGCLFSFIQHAGRGNIISFFLLFYLTYVLYKQSYSFKWIIPILLLGCCIVIFGKPFFGSLGYLSIGFDEFKINLTDNITRSFQLKIASNLLIVDLLKAFTHRIISLQTALGVVSEDISRLRWFVDIPYGIISLIPSRLTGIYNPPTIIAYNTYYISGVFETTVPPGWIAFGYYSLSWPGLFIAGFFYGFIGRYLQTVILQNYKKTFWMPVAFVVTSWMWGYGMQGGEPRLFLQCYFMFFVVLIYFFFISSRISFALSANRRI